MIQVINFIIHSIIKFIIHTALSLELRTTKGFVPRDFGLSKRSLQRCTTIPTWKNETNLHTLGPVVRVATRFQPFLNVTLISTNGLC